MFFLTPWLIYRNAIDARLWPYLAMPNRSKIAERLLVHATMCQEAASLCWNEATAFELENLAEDCRHAAAACEPELPHATTTHWKN
jgi:hypothetical protein